MPPSRLLACFLLLCPMYLAGPAPAGDDVTTWRASAAKLDDIRVTYSTESGPTAAHMAEVRKNRTPPEQIPLFIILMLSRDRSTVTLMRQGKLRKYELREQRSEDELIRAGLVTAGEHKEQFGPGPGFLVEMVSAEWHTTNDRAISRTSVFKALDRLNQNGSIWADWGTDTDPRTILDEAIPPSEQEGTFTPVNGKDHVYDFKTTKGSSLTRYHLDPQNGMMPSRIDYIQTGKSLFLFRFVEIKRYESRDGIFIPAAATSYETNGEEGKKDREGRVQATKIETRMNFQPADFDLQFPVGVYVTDHTTGNQHRVKPPEVEAMDAARQLNKQGKWREAAAALRAVAEEYPQHQAATEALEEAASIYEKRLNDTVSAAEVRKALVALRETLVSTQTDPLALYELASASAAAGDAQKAVDAYRKFLAGENKDGKMRVLAQYRLAGLLGKMNQTKEALAAYAAVEATQANDDYSKQIKEKAKQELGALQKN